jgi:hypothetical protein
MSVREVRGPCRHLVARLDVERRIWEVKCRSCSWRYRVTVTHLFDSETGEALTQEAARARGAKKPDPLRS